MRLGLDFGGVIAQAADGTGRVVSMDIEDVPPIKGAHDGVRQLSKLLEGRIWIISKASSDTEAQTGVWLHRYEFIGRGFVPIENLVFVRDRSGKRVERESCGITHYVDDRHENLELLEGIVDYPYLFSEKPCEERKLFGVKHLFGWQELVRMPVEYGL